MPLGIWVGTGTAVNKGPLKKELTERKPILSRVTTAAILTGGILIWAEPYIIYDLGRMARVK